MTAGFSLPDIRQERSQEFPLVRFAFTFDDIVLLALV